MLLFGPITIRTSIIIILLIAIICVKVLEGKCPSKSYSWCLQIDGYDSVILDGNRFHKVKGVFRQIGHLFNETESKHFEQLLLFNNQEVENLEENSFADFTFKNIIIRNCTKLKRIDPEAFNGTQHLITKVYIDLISISGEHNVKDFFEALNSLTKLEELELLNHNIITIPTFAFTQPLLNRLELDGPLDSINTNAFFFLKNLRILKLFKSVNHIPQHAFDFKSPSNKTLDIYFDIKFTSIERGIFKGIQRPITLNLFLIKLKSFDEKVFDSLLMSDIRHDIIFHGELKDMYDKCILFWLFINKNNFKGKYSFKTDPTIAEKDFDNCHYNKDEKTTSNIVRTDPKGNDCPYVSPIVKNLLTIVSSLYLIMSLFINFN